MAAGVARVAVLRGAELVDHAVGRLLLRPLSAKRVVREATRVFKAHRTVRFDGRVAYPELLVIEVAPAVVDACPEMFDRDGCRAIAEMIADSLEELDHQRPTIAIAFERNWAVEKSRAFRIARDGAARRVAGTRAPSGRRPDNVEEGGRTSTPPTLLRNAAPSGARTPDAGDDIETLDALWRLLDNLGGIESLVGLSGLARADLDASRATREALLESHPLRTFGSVTDLRRALELARRAALQATKPRPGTSRTG